MKLLKPNSQSAANDICCVVIDCVNGIVTNYADWKDEHHGVDTSELERSLANSIFTLLLSERQITNAIANLPELDAETEQK